MARKQTVRDFSFSAEMISDRDSLPPVLRNYRDQALKAFQDLPLPSLKDEAWRRTSLQGFNFEALQLPESNPDQEDLGRNGFGVIPENAILGKSAAIITPRGVEITRTPELISSGIIFSSLREAAEDHPDLLEKILGQAVSPSDGKFAAVTGAFAEQGLFLYVPKEVVLDQPIFGISFAPGGNTAFFTQYLIYLEEGSSINFLQETISPQEDKDQSLTSENLEIFVGPNAKLSYTELQTYSDKVWSFGHKKALIERDGFLEWEIGALGSSLCKHFVEVDLIGKGAEARVSGMFFADQNQHLTYNTLQRHLAPRTTSDLLFKGALSGESRSVWRGMIYVAPGARFIDGYQANRNLVLDPKARSDSIPGLEILNNDVRCTHGSTVGKIDQEQLFYLLSRGIPDNEAQQLIIQGFFEDILTRFSIQEVSDELWSRIKDRILA
jgi:Fe-S cluster assembly protein SufD